MGDFGSLEDRKRTQLDSLRDNISTAPAGVSPRVDRKIVSPARTNKHAARTGQDRWRGGREVGGTTACVRMRERA